MGFARSVSVPVHISWFLAAATKFAAQQELSGSVVDGSGSTLTPVAVKHRAPR
jgi:hypothetical protein